MAGQNCSSGPISHYATIGPCKDWDGYLRSGGYGYIRVDGKRWPAHRWVFFQAHGYLPPVVRHRCDRPICVRLAHLEPGTQADNLRDAIVRGRARRALALENGRAKLSDEQIVEIRSRYPGEKMATLAGEYGIAEGYVSRIIAGLCRTRAGGLASPRLPASGPGSSRTRRA